MESKPIWRSTIDCLFDHPTRPAVLLMKSAAGLAMPRVTTALRFWYPMIAPLLPILRTALGWELTILRCAAMQTDLERHSRDLVYQCAFVGPLPDLPAHYLWGERADLERVVPEQRTLVAAALDERDAGIPTLRAAWSRSGWWDAATDWARSVVTEQGLPPIERIEPIKLWDLSYVWRVVTGPTLLFFKAIPTRPSPGTRQVLFANEPVLLDQLAAAFPQYLPRPVAIDAQRAWMLLPDLGDDLRAQRDPRMWFAALDAFADLQIVASQDLDRLQRAGCLDRRLPVLLDQIDSLPDDPAVHAALSPDDLRHLRAVIPALRQRGEQLAALPIPATLVHGDLNPGNIAVRGQRITFFDWTDGCIAHPFLDLAPFLEEATEFFGTPTAADDLRDRYLQHWVAFAPIETLREAFDLARPLGSLHQLVSYVHLIANVEPVSTEALSSDLRFFARQLMKLLES